MRGTFKGIEVERRGGEQARRRVGSLKAPLRPPQYTERSQTRPRSDFFISLLATSPRTNSLLMVCCFKSSLSVVGHCAGRAALAEGD